MLKIRALSRWFLLTSILLLFLFFLTTTPAHASALFSSTPPQVSSTLAGPSMTVTAGFDARYRDGNWIPVRVSLRNDGPDFSGKISISVPPPRIGIGTTGGNTGAPSPILASYQEPVSLPSGSQKQVTLFVPLFFGLAVPPSGIAVDLLDANNHKVLSQSSPIRPLTPNETMIGLLSNQPATSFASLFSANLITNPTSSFFAEPLNATNMPTMPAVLSNFDVIVLDNFTTSSLSADQLAALQGWVYQGGALIIAAGPEWQKTLASLPSALLPVAVTGSTTLPPGTHLLPIGGPSLGGPQTATITDTLKTAVPASAATPSEGSSVLLASAHTPLIVQATRGHGLVSYIAVDPTLDPLASWPGSSRLWAGLLLRSLGNQLLVSTTNASAQTINASSLDNGAMEILLHSFFPSAIPATWLILTLLFSYVLILGPIRLLIVRFFKKPAWSWRIVLVSILVFSSLTYSLALFQKDTSVISSSLSIIQLNRPLSGNTLVTPAHLTTYLGVYVPNQGDFKIHIPGNNLVRLSSNSDHLFVSDANDQSVQQQSAAFSSSPNESNVSLQGVDIWTVRSLIYQHDLMQRGGVISHLTLSGNTLNGTVTNSLPYALNDAYVLMSNHYVALGRLAAGQSRSVHLTLSDDTIPIGQNSIADQIAFHNKLSTPYNPSENPPKSEQQRHIALLTALSGELPDCTVYSTTPGSIKYACVSFRAASNSYTVPTTAGPFLTSESDPLLLSGAPATLIGWVDHSPDANANITINGNTPSQDQNFLVQAPLDLSYANPVDLPTTLITGQLVDVHTTSNTAVQLPVAGVYTLAPGSSITFELTVPVIPKFHGTNFLFNEPNNLLQLLPTTTGAGPGQFTDVNSLTFNIYNWQTHSWQANSMNGYTFAQDSPDPYIDAFGRVLVQFSNDASQSGPGAVLTLPTLEVQGNILS